MFCVCSVAVRVERLLRSVRVVCVYVLSNLKYRKKVMVLVSMDAVPVEDACWTYFNVILAHLILWLDA